MIPMLLPATLPSECLGAHHPYQRFPQIYRSCQLIKKSALLPYAATAGLPAVARCVLAFLLPLYALEETHTMALRHVAFEELWPVVEQVSWKGVGMQ
jgi:hypothetical protein